MSILIKGMKMSNNCQSCPFSDDECRYCKAANKYIPMLGKPKFCPLVEVPTPHGPLVDADALKATFCAECNHTITCEDCDIDYHIGRLAPTIIEAEEGEKHERPFRV